MNEINHTQNSVLQRLETACNTNPAEALAMLPEVMKAVHEGYIKWLH